MATDSTSQLKTLAKKIGGLSVLLTIITVVALQGFFPEVISDMGRQIDSSFNFILVVTTFVFFAVEGVFLAFLLKYKAKEGVKATYYEGNNTLEVVWTMIPLVFFIGLALSSDGAWKNLKANVPANPDQLIKITAEQFAWNFHYSGPDKKFDTADDVKTLNQLHVPVNQEILAELRSKDVLHSFFLPNLRFKQDAVPGLVVPIWFKADTVGNYEVACAELCGLGHYRMKGFLTVEDEASYTTWMDETRAAAAEASSDDEDESYEEEEEVDSEEAEVAVEDETSEDEETTEESSDDEAVAEEEAVADEVSEDEEAASGDDAADDEAVAEEVATDEAEETASADGAEEAEDHDSAEEATDASGDDEYDVEYEEEEE